MESGGPGAQEYVPAPPATTMEKIGDWMYDFPNRDHPAPGESHMHDGESVLEWLGRMITGG